MLDFRVLWCGCAFVVDGWRFKLLVVTVAMAAVERCCVVVVVQGRKRGECDAV
jgi:hypothetical protein